MLVGLFAGCGNHKAGKAEVSRVDTAAGEQARSEAVPDKIVRSDDEWRRLLTEEQYRIPREGGTEPAFTGKYYDFKGKGMYLCVACGNELFSSDAKFDSGTGWPSFWEPVSGRRVAELADKSHGMIRVEVRCGRCDAHLGHVFEDGPAPTGLRYCINSAALKFVDSKKDPTAR
jgi:peptide-methionine (R)-S-oxide reductase